MKKMAYFKIEQNLTPHDANNVLEQAKKSGIDSVVVLHEKGAELKGKYTDKILSVFRAAFRNKVGIYLSDDSFFASGTGFGQVASVKDLWQKVLVKIKLSDVGEDEKILAKRDDECIVARVMENDDEYPYGHYPSLTDPFAAQLVIESVYAPLVREYIKFAGFEFKGFACVNPLYDLNCDNVPYSPRALDMFYDKQKRKADLFALLEKEGEYNKYMSALRSAMEENFILPLKKFCSDKNMELIVSGGEKSASALFCEKQKIMFLSDSVKSKNGYLMPCDNIKKVMEAGINRMGIVTKISPGVEKISHLRTFFHEHGGKWEVLKLEDFNGFKSSDKYILTNMENKIKDVCILLDEDCCLYDWETEEYYVFEKEKTYSFYPYSFMCITKKGDKYTDKLPLRVGGVKCGDTNEETTLEFERRGDKYGFYFPDEPLYGKSLEIVGEGECIEVRMGSMEHTFISKPYILPLFEFLRGGGCVVECFNGELTEFKIIE